MRVLIVTSSLSNPYLDPPAASHNILKGFIKIERELEKNDVNISFLSINDEVKNKDITSKIKIIGTRRYPPVTFTGELQALLCMNSGFDLVHSHNIHELFPYLLSKMPTIFTLHEIFWKDIKFKNGFYPKIWLKLEELRLKLYYPKLSRFIAISPYVIEELKTKGFDISKAVVIENPVSDEFFAIEKKEEPIILYPASLIPLKNQLGFLMAASTIKNELKNYKIVFAGAGDRNYEEKLRKFVKDSNLNVEFLGKVPYEKMPELYSKASVVALTSFQETLPMAVLEALSTGTPVVASNVGGIPYALRDGATGFVCNPKNPTEVAEKLLALLNDGDLRKRLGREAAEEAKRRWRAEIIAKRHLDLYLNLRGE